MTIAPRTGRDQQGLAPLLAAEPALRSLIGSQSGAVVVPEAARAMAVAGLATASSRRPLLVAVPTRAEAESLAADLRVFLGADAVDELLAWETLPFERVSPSVWAMGQRSRTLHRITAAQHPEDESADALRVVVASARALVQMVDEASLVAPVRIAQGANLHQESLIETLAGFGYRREHQVEHRGEMAVRGSIVDVFASTAEAPVRIDLWGDEVDRLTEFSPDDQRATIGLTHVEIHPAREVRPDAAMRARAEALTGSAAWGKGHWERVAAGEMFEGIESWWPWLAERPVSVMDLLGRGCAVALVEPRRLKDRASNIVDEEHDLAEVLGRSWGLQAAEVPGLHAAFDELVAPDGVAVWTMPATPDPSCDLNVDASGWGSAGVGLPERAERIKALVADGYKLAVCADGEAAARRIEGLLSDHGVSLADRPATLDLEQGAVMHSVKLAVLASGDLTGRRRTRRSAAMADREARREAARARRDVQRFYDQLEVGSFVVHHQHGIARFEGMVRRKVGGAEREFMLLAYRGADRLYVPSDQVDLVRHYSGGESPKLSRMGGSDWAATKSKVRRAVAEVARDLVGLYKRRLTAEGHAFGADTVSQRELEDSFEYVETADQLRALDDVKADMHSASPMDRLVVGDVGFGKTEIAVRAAFKAVLDGRQVAVLTPTTLLAHQHTQTFLDRFAPFPVKVAMLSRFLSTAEARQVVNGLASGEVDVVIGTHRLLSGDVRFARLGLLVIDEEQRFGVRHKESIKALRADLDVLTLTATPVPRTLELSLTGIRDMSVLHTPPADRQPILTYVGEKADRPMAEAIRRELLREGQVFYVHNRVADIDHIAQRVRRLVPEAKVAVAHGQMDENALEKVVMDFSEHRYDVLVCTTIIESGIDMPTVNTLIVDRADRLGLGQLHQIRGRVGRSGRRAYAYLFHPADKVLSEAAYERLKTIGEATELGSGYRIAMRDLEIRGAGNLLGEAQSGHIAAVGYDLYCELVTEAVAELKGKRPESAPTVKIEAPVGAHIPLDYITDDAARLESYRKLSGVLTHDEVDDTASEWVDRFGPVPGPAEALLSVARLRVDCLRVGLSEVTVVATGAGMGRSDTGGYRARLAPVMLPASRQARLKRLYGTAAVYKPTLSELSLRLRTGDGPVIEQVRAVIAGIVSIDSDADPGASRPSATQPAAARPSGSAGPQRGRR